MGGALSEKALKRPTQREREKKEEGGGGGGGGGLSEKALKRPTQWERRKKRRAWWGGGTFRKITKTPNTVREEKKKKKKESYEVPYKIGTSVKKELAGWKPTPTSTRTPLSTQDRKEPRNVLKRIQPLKEDDDLGRTMSRKKGTSEKNGALPAKTNRTTKRKKKWAERSPKKKPWKAALERERNAENEITLLQNATQTSGLRLRKAGRFSYGESPRTPPLEETSLHRRNNSVERPWGILSLFTTCLQLWVKSPCHRLWHVSPMPGKAKWEERSHMKR